MINPKKGAIAPLVDAPMPEADKKNIRIALTYCRDRIEIPSRGAIDYHDVARQIAALPDAENLRYMVAWVIGYESHDPDIMTRPMSAEDYAGLDARRAQQQQ